MSDQNMSAGVPAEAQMLPPAEATPQQGQGAKKLSTFLKVSIVLLAAVTIASISLLFIGDFEGKFERVFSTFVLFAVFVTFTALDTRRQKKSDWYAPVALIANAYILGLLLIVIWMTTDTFSLIFTIFWKSLFVIVATRTVIICCELLLRSGNKLPEAVTRFAFVTSVLAVLSGILFTAPVGLDAFDLVIPDLYWKIATALLILTALGLSITLLLRWTYRSDRKEEARAQFAATPAPAPVPPFVAQQYPAQQYPAQQYPAVPVPVQPIPVQPMQSLPAPQQPEPQVAAPQMQAPQAPAEPMPVNLPAHPVAAPVPPAPPVDAAQQVGTDGQPLLPWPTFADGSPLPAGADGQPDFSVLQ